MSNLGFLTRLVGWTAGGALIGVLVMIAPSRVAGYAAYTVLSGSMQPAIAAGDVVVDEPVRPTELRSGDIVTFKDPDDDQRLITHRVRRIDIGPQRAHVVTRGDANDTDERWTIARDGRVGRVAARLPRLGYALSWAHSLPGQILTLIAPAVALLALELRALWAPRRRVPT